MYEVFGRWLTDQRQLPEQMDNEAGRVQPAPLLTTRIAGLAAEISREIVPVTYPTLKPCQETHPTKMAADDGSRKLST